MAPFLRLRVFIVLKVVTNEFVDRLDIAVRCSLPRGRNLASRNGNNVFFSSGRNHDGKFLRLRLGSLRVHGCRPICRASYQKAAEDGQKDNYLRHLTRIRSIFWVFQEKCPIFGSNPA